MNRHYNRQLGCRLRNERGEKSEEEEEVQQLPRREGQGGKPRDKERKPIMGGGLGCYILNRV